MGENPSTKDFVSREYQTELFEMAIKENAILYLPTGSGKTYIAILLIKHFGNNNKLLKTSIEDGGKRTFFLVNTVALVQQQVEHIKSQTLFDAKGYSGDMGVDFWPESEWLQELNSFQVLVMTSQILLNLIQSHMIGIKNINLLIFDECHSAVSNHPMRQIMQMFKDVPQSQQPRILGLTATLLNGNIKASQLEAEIRTLENTFMARIATSSNEELVKSFSTNPKETKVIYEDNKKDENINCYKIKDALIKQCTEFVLGAQLDDIHLPPPGSKPENSRLLDTNWTKTNKRVKNLLGDIQINFNELGVYGGSLAALAHLVQILQLLVNCQQETTFLLLQSIVSDCVMLRKVCELEMKSTPLSNAETLRLFSSDKVRKLLDIMRKVKKDDSVIVFVQRRFTAKILYYLMKRASEMDPRLKNIKANFIVGFNVANPFKDTRENYLQRRQNVKVMKLFNQGEINVLFASKVVEEGIDIAQCNFVIMFDPPLDFRSYIQSKGRARDKDSNYIIMTSNTDTKFQSNYCSFVETEKCLKNILYRGRSSPTSDEVDAQLFAEAPGLESYRPFGIGGPVITALSAIPLLNRYIASLKADKFSKIIPHWFIQEEGNQCRCILLLPMESRVRGAVKGTWQFNKEDSKRSAALEACKKLHEYKELDDNYLLPVGLNIPAMKDASFTPNKDDSEVSETVIEDKRVKVGTKKYKRTWDKKWADCLSKCRPQPNETSYLYVLDVKPVYKPPADNNRLIEVHNTLNQQTNFALLSSKKLPQLAQFPLYTSTGELEATVRHVQLITLDEAQLLQIIDFHCFIFDKVLNVAKKFMIRDFSNTQNSYLIAPVIQDNSKEVKIDWSILEEAYKPYPTAEPTKEERSSMKITNENYLGKIVSPWYRIQRQDYLVTKVCYDMSENSAFPTDTYPTYKEYFADKYKIEPLITGQPLIEVRALSSKLNCIKPRALTKQLKRKNKEENEDFEVWLIPEFCLVYPLPGRYWVKALLLPSVLHRISQLCMAEELRCRIVQDTGVGFINLPPGTSWNKLKEDPSLTKKEILSENEQALTPLLSKSHTSAKCNHSDIEGPEPVDIDRSLESVSVFDIINYAHYIGQTVTSGSFKISDEKIIDRRALNGTHNMVEAPPLTMLRNTTKGLGPQQVEVMQALTAAFANDFTNCERLETLGDSFLKLVISLTLFETDSNWLEGHLTHLKGSIVGNKNLFYCGKAKNLGSMLEVHDFSPKQDWVAPGFCVQQSIQTVLRTAKLNQNCLYNVEIPIEERTSGILSADTNSKFSKVLFTAEDVIQPQTYPFINQLALTDKNVSDAVEAILGVYLKSCGIYGALAVLNWFKVTNPALSTPEIFSKKSSPPAKGEAHLHPNFHTKLYNLLTEPNRLEEILNYTFKDKCYMLQAVSHPSFTRNNITQCYQRLEFLGDALIDFLITIHIYEKCTKLSPGDLTDLRSALVNNITLACIVVRSQLYKFLLIQSSMLLDFIMRFVKHQADRNHVIDNDILFLFEEDEVNVSEAVDVPKTLGDLFESIIGAVYLDSGKNLDITWKVLYNLMKDEIENFSKDVPKNHVRMLYESKCSPTFTSQILEENNVVMTSVEIMHKGEALQFNGFGDTKKQAKRAAAKHALRKIHKSSQQ